MQHKKIVGMLVFVATAVAVLALLSAPLSAQTRPALVKDVENPAQNPFWGHGSGSIALNFVNTNISLGLVEAGMRLAIEHVSVRCEADADDEFPQADIWVYQKTGPASWNGYAVPIQMQKQGLTWNGRSSWIASQPIRVYSDGGISQTTVTIYHKKTTATASCYAHVSGYKVVTQ